MDCRRFVLVTSTVLALTPAAFAARAFADSTAIAVGGLVGSALSGPVKHVTHPGRAMLITSATWGAALAGFGAVNGLAFVAYQHLDKSAPAVA